MQKSNCYEREILSLNMKIGEVKIIPVKDKGTLFAIASFVINHWFYFGGVGVHYDSAKRRYSLTFPTKTLRNGLEVALYHPLSKEVSDVIQEAIVKEWDRVIR